MQVIAADGEQKAARALKVENLPSHEHQLLLGKLSKTT